MKSSYTRLIIALLALLHLSLPAATYYVDANGTNPASPYAGWSTAATNLQDAASLAGSGDAILVTNGVYQSGGWSFNGSNRVYIASGVTMQSVNGPADTTIAGYQMPGSTNGSLAVRCVYLADGAMLSGFTLTNGATQTSGATDGGGVYCQSAAAVVTNCVIAGNVAYNFGGGAYSGTLNNCVLAGNFIFAVSGGGGGAAQAVLNNCVLYCNGTAPGGFGGAVNHCTLNGCVVTNNSGAYGSGVAFGVANNCLLAGNTNSSAAYLGILNNCTIAGNYSLGLGAADGCTLNNSIIYYNSNGLYADCYQCRLTNCCTTIGTGNASLSNQSTSNAPSFVDPAHGNYHLNPWSPCVNTGNNAIVTNSTDLDGNPRIIGAAVDMGGYENQNTNPVHYVQLNNFTPVAPFTNWLTAATNIQDAVDAAVAGDFIVVSNGTYKTGGRAVYGLATNRVTIDKAVIVQSLNGSLVTSIVGFNGEPTSSFSVRCAYLTNGAALNGFTLSGGAGRLNGGNLTNEQSGGGVWCESSMATISNCVLSGNVALEYGGAAYQGTFNNCLIISNTAFINGGGTYGANLNNCIVNSNKTVQGFGGGGVAFGSLSNCLLAWNFTPAVGGGAWFSSLNNCVVSNNTAGNGGGLASCTAVNSLISSNSTRLNGSGGGAYSNALYDCILKNNVANSSGGGAYAGVLVNCTVVSNTAGSFGGGTFWASQTNSVIYYNFAPKNPNCQLFQTNYPAFCCTTPLLTNGLGNITNEPLFVNLATGDFHLQSNSPCLNSGNNACVTNATDFDGNPRIAGGTADIGAYEYPAPASILSYAWAQLYGLATDGSADFLDSDGDGMNNFHEWKAETSPIDATSVLRLLSPSNSLSGIAVTWQSVGGVTYYLQRSRSLTAFTAIQSNLVGQAGSTTYVDTGATNGGPFFYRAGVQ